MSPRGTAQRRAPSTTTIVLDADAVSKLARGDRRSSAMVNRISRERVTRLAIPYVSVIQALAEGVGMRAVENLLSTAWATSGIDLSRATLSSSLLRATRTTDVPDALVAVEALLHVPAVVITSDPDDLRQLLDTDLRGQRVEVWPI